MMPVFVGSKVLWNRSMSFARWREVTRADDSAGAAHGSKVSMVATKILHSQSVETPCFRGRADHP